MNFDLSDDQRTIKSTARELLAARYPLSRGAAAGARRRARVDRRAVGRDGRARLARDRRARHGRDDRASPRSSATRWRRRRCSRPGRPACSAPTSSTGGRGAVVIDGLARRRRHGRRARRLGRRRGHRRATVEPVRGARSRRGGWFRVSGGERSPRGGDVERGRGQATVMNAAESVGVAARAMEMAVEYAKERKQFGRPIGTYQAVSHACAQMLLEVEGARVGRLLGGMGARPRARDRAAGGRVREGLRGRRGPARPACGAAGPRRHRLHLGARPALLPQARRGERPRVRRRRRPPRARRGPDRALNPRRRGRVCPWSGASLDEGR